MSKINRTLAVAMVVASSMSLGACSLFTSENAYHKQPQLNAATEGAGMGAVGGAVIAGIATGGPGAVVGAAIGGGAVGTGVGVYLDQDEAKIRDQLRSAGVSVVEVGYKNDLVLLLPSDVHFAFDSAELTDQFKPSLNAVAEVLKEYPYTVAEIPGNTDYIGSARYNMQLSLARAQVVSDYLYGQGIPGNRLVPLGFGEYRPIANNRTPQGRAMNRRVEIILHAPPIPNRK